MQDIPTGRFALGMIAGWSDEITKGSSVSSPDISGWQYGPPTGWSVAGSPAGHQQGLQDGGVDSGQFLFWNWPLGSWDQSVLRQDNLYSVLSAGDVGKSLSAYFNPTSNDGAQQVFLDLVSRGDGPRDSRTLHLPDLGPRPAGGSVLRLAAKEDAMIDNANTRAARPLGPIESCSSTFL